MELEIQVGVMMKPKTKLKAHSAGDPRVESIESNYRWRLRYKRAPPEEKHNVIGGRAVAAMDPNSCVCEGRRRLSTCSVLHHHKRCCRRLLALGCAVTTLFSERLPNLMFSWIPKCIPEKSPKSSLPVGYRSKISCA